MLVSPPRRSLLRATSLLSLGYLVLPSLSKGIIYLFIYYLLI